jgi:hypothetical protein
MLDPRNLSEPSKINLRFEVLTAAKTSNVVCVVTIFDFLGYHLQDYTALQPKRPQSTSTGNEVHATGPAHHIQTSLLLSISSYEQRMGIIGS